ncbi:MAG: hypothetical protein ACKOHG_15855 [Planctomycetia bacterium]
MERTGHDFSAAFSGKLKMVLQCAAIALELATRAAPDRTVAGVGLGSLASWSAWDAVATTVWSGAEYLVASRGMITTPEGGDGDRDP